MEQDIFDWLKDFKKRNQRNLRILHVGNVANNAYLNAKFLRNFGVDVDVMVRDDCYIMTCSEWEDVYITRYKGSSFFPRFSRKDIGSYKRPEWFIQGPMILCTRYLMAKHRKRKWSCKFYEFLNRLSRHSYLSFLVITVLSLLATGSFSFLWRKINKKISKLISNKINIFNKKSKENKFFEVLRREFREYFKNRIDYLTDEDMSEYSENEKNWKEMAKCYDIIQFYGTDPILAVISNIKPYIAFEHGTLRDYTLGNCSLHRMNALAYRKADHVFITNGDCLPYAHTLGIQNFSGIAHPIEVSPFETERRNALKTRKILKINLLLFCPIRHDWEIKGPEFHIKALPIISDAFNGTIKLILCEWGHDLSRSKALVKELNIEDKITWLQPLCRKKLIETMLACDIVLDQMVLPCFGSTAPQALALEKPVIMSYKPESTAWLFPEPPPILSAFSVEDVVSRVSQAMNPDWLDNFKKQAKRWVDTYHHPNVIVKQHLQVYRHILEGLK